MTIHGTDYSLWPIRVKRHAAECLQGMSADGGEGKEVTGADAFHSETSIFPVGVAGPMLYMICDATH